MSVATEGALAATFREEMRLWDAQKADGVSLVDRLRGLELTLRQAWPQTREWKYLCRECDDYGLVMALCPCDATCGRPKPHLQHEFGRPCWCQHGARFRQTPKAETSERPVKKPTKVGR